MVKSHNRKRRPEKCILQDIASSGVTEEGTLQVGASDLERTETDPFPPIRRKSSISAAEVSPVTAHKDDQVSPVTAHKDDQVDKFVNKKDIQNLETDSQIVDQEAPGTDPHEQTQKTDQQGCVLNTKNSSLQRKQQDVPGSTDDTSKELKEELEDTLEVLLMTPANEHGEPTAKVDDAYSDAENMPGVSDESVGYQQPEELDDGKMAPQVAPSDRASPSSNKEGISGEVVIESNNPQGESKGKPVVSPGPYSLIKVIDSIPVENPEIPESKDAFLTCVEAWESNIYFGTSAGEILHMYKLDDELGYILVSRQRFHSTKVRPIVKIVLLASIQRAIVQCGSVVSLFMLPEFSPANIGRIRDVNDVSLDIQHFTLDAKRRNYVPETISGDEESIEVTIFTKKCLRLIRVTPSGLRLIKDLNYPNSVMGLRRSEFAAVATNTNYDLVDLKKVQRIPLFPLSQGGEQPDLKPIIHSVSKSEFLFTCGTGLTDPAMGMVVNLNGDISRGTLTWPCYPNSLAIDYPYSLATNSTALLIHSLHNQHECQTIEFAGKVDVSSVSHIFQTPSDELTHAISKVSLIDGSNIKSPIYHHSLRTSTTLVYGADIGVYVLYPSSRILRLLKIASQANELTRTAIVDEIEEEIKDIDDKDEFGKIEKQMSECLIGLILLHHLDFNQSFDYWFTGLLDPRLMLYIFGSVDHLTNDVQIYSGLLPLITLTQKQYKNALQSSNDVSRAMHEFYRFFLKTWISNKDSPKLLGDKNDMIRSFELCLLEECGALPTTKAELMEQVSIITENIDLSKEQALSWMKKNKRYFLLGKFYEKHHDITDFVPIWEGLVSGEIVDTDFELEYDELPGTALTHLVNNVVNYCEDENLFWTTLEWFTNRYPSYSIPLLTDKRLKVDVSELRVLKLLTKNEQSDALKLQYLDFIVNTRGEKQFLGDLIVQVADSLVSLISSDANTWGILLRIVESYKRLNIPRMPFPSYLNFETKKESMERFTELHENLVRLLGHVNSETEVLSSNSRVVEVCHAKLEPLKQVLPHLTAAIEFKAHRYDIVINILCDLGDFRTAESFAVTLELPLLAREIAPLPKVDKGESEKYLLQIFEIYLESNENELIEGFLNRYNVFSTSQTSNDPENPLDVSDNFSAFLDRIPEKFRVSQVCSFLSKNLITIQDQVMASNIHKSIAKAEAQTYRKVSRDLHNNAT